MITKLILCHDVALWAKGFFHLQPGESNCQYRHLVFSHIALCPFPSFLFLLSCLRIVAFNNRIVVNRNFNRKLVYIIYWNILKYKRLRLAKIGGEENDEGPPHITDLDRQLGPSTSAHYFRKIRLK